MKQKRIAAANQLANSINGVINGLDMSSSTRNRLAGAAYCIALEHFDAIVILLGLQRHAAAMALLRVEHEAFVFGHWIESCASEAELNRLVDRNQKPKIDRMLRRIKESELGDENSILNNAFSQNKKVYDGHAHADMIPISRMIGDGWIGDSFAEDEIVESLDSAGCYALLAALGISRLVNDIALAKKFLDLSNSWTVPA